MLKVESRTGNCPTSSNLFQNPLIHNGSLQPQEYMLKSVQRDGQGKRFFNVKTTWQQFRRDTHLRAGIETFPHTVLPSVTEKASEVLKPQHRFEKVSIRENPKKFFLLLNDIREKDRELYFAHVKKEDTRRLSVDKENGYIGVYKESRQWHFYKMGNGSGPELYKSKRLEEGIRFIFSEQR